MEYQMRKHNSDAHVTRSVVRVPSGRISSPLLQQAGEQAGNPATTVGTTYRLLDASAASLLYCCDAS
jgi:hypothetical protein